MYAFFRVAAAFRSVSAFSTDESLVREGSHDRATQPVITVKIRLARSLVALSPLCLLAPAQASGAKSMPSEMRVQIEDFQAAHVLPQSITPKILGLATSAADLTALLGGTGAQNQCLSYTYDKNGNRTSQNNRAFGTTATWGASTYGCFNWTSP